MERLLFGLWKCDGCADHDFKSKSNIHEYYYDEYGRNFHPVSGGGFMFVFFRDDDGNRMTKMMEVMNDKKIHSGSGGGVTLAFLSCIWPHT